MNGVTETPPLPQGPILLLAPHPDDEVIGAGGLLSEARARGTEVWVVLVTAGDAFPWSLPHRLRHPFHRHLAQCALGEDRLAEARRSTARLGIPGDHVLFLGFPDRGLTALLGPNERAPYTSGATGASAVLYPEALQPGLAYTGEALRAQLRALLADLRPRSVLAPGPLDSHGNHRALAALARELVRPPARLYYYPAHGSLTWPFPKGDHEDWPLEPPPGYEPGAHWRHYPLDARARARKRAALEAHTSQLRVMAVTLKAYLRREELLLPAGDA